MSACHTHSRQQKNQNSHLTRYAWFRCEYQKRLPGIPMTHRIHILKSYSLLLMCFLLLFPPPSLAEDQKNIAVVISRRIKPYMMVLKGVRQGLDRESTVHMDVFFLSSSKRFAPEITNKLIEKPYDFFLAVGPEAARLIWSMEALQHRKKLFSAILAPQKISHLNSAACGISLQIPVETQLAEISAALPETRSIGLLFDPAQNLLFFKAAQAAGLRNGIDVKSLAVNSKADIPRVLKRNLSSVDCIWMIPDPTVISEKIVQYIIKKSLYRKKGVIGYNTYFIKSGAVLAFVFDYTEIGLQTADAVKTYFTKGECTTITPLFHPRANTKIADTIGIKLEVSTQ